MIDQDHIYIIQFSCYMQDSIHFMEPCCNAQLHYAVIGIDGDYQGMTCNAHLAYTKDLNKRCGAQVSYAPFMLLDSPHYKD